MRKSVLIILFATALTARLAWSQQKQQNSQSTPGMDMSTPTSGMKDMPGMDAATSAPAMHSMEGHHMDIGPHMKMTTLRDPKPGDEQRAQKVVEAARHVSEKYKDYHTALADGFKIFLPNVPQKMYHFTNYKYAFEAAFSFNPDHPTSLLYGKHGDDYKLVGVMYTAPKRYDEADLDKRIPLSIAQWHEHVNLCMRVGTPLRTSSTIADCGPSATSPVSSSPRMIGPGCITMASFFAIFIRYAVIW